MASDRYRLAGDLTSFDVKVDDKLFSRYRTPLTGMFNVRNCLSVIAASESLGLDRKAVAEALISFKSVKRRMQVRGVARGVTVIDDFAHHPTAVRETLQAARQRYRGSRITAILEPRSYTAQLKSFQKDFVNSLAVADRIIISGLFHPERYTAESGASPAEMALELQRMGREARSIDTVDKI